MLIHTDYSKPFSNSQAHALQIAGRLSSNFDRCEQNHPVIWHHESPQLPAGKSDTSPHHADPHYFIQCASMLNSIPVAMRVTVNTVGKKDGTKQKAKLSVIHWHAETGHIGLALTYFQLGWPTPRYFPLLRLNTHALDRLFYCLKTVDPFDIYSELHDASIAFCRWLTFFKVLLLANNTEISIGLPTPNGVLYLQNTGAQNGANTLEMLNTNWVSDAHMNVGEAKLLQARRARDERGFVLLVGQQCHAVTPAHIMGGLTAPDLGIDASYMDELIPFLGTSLTDYKERPNNLTPC